jgi:O-Glycosyl hydrolase family 30
VLRDAIGRQPRSSFRLEAFANSPPWWMTANGCPQGSAVLFGENLSSDRFGDYADYLVSVLRAFRRAGIDFATVDPLNEPENPWGAQGLLCPTGDCQEGASLGNPSQRLLLEEVCRRLGSRPRDTRLSTPDGFNPTDTAAMFGLAGYGDLPAGCFAQVNTHMYDFVPPSSLVPYGQGISVYGQGGGQRAALFDLARRSGKRLWMSEFGTGGTAADMTSALTYSSTIAGDLKYLRPDAWVNWQAVEASGHWGLFEAPSWPAEGPVVKTKRFFAMEQYSRFIRPGYRLLAATDPLDDPGHETASTVAAVNDPRHPRRIVIVGTNVGGDRSVTYDLGRLGVLRAGGDAVLTRFRTAADEQPPGAPAPTAHDVQRLGSSPLRATSFTDDQPAGSITTYVIDIRGI